MIGDTLPRRLALVRRCAADELGLQHRPGSYGAGLSDAGRREALTATGRLARSRWSWLATSPSEPAVATARVIAVEFPHAPLIEHPALAEHVDEDPAPNLRARGVDAILRLLHENHGDGIVVSHGHLLSAVIADLCGIEPPGLMEGAVVVLRHRSDGWEISHGSALGLVVMA